MAAIKIVQDENSYMRYMGETIDINMVETKDTSKWAISIDWSGAD